MEIELRRLIGHQIVVKGPVFVDNEKLHSVKLLAVEEAGIWIESQEAVDKVIGRLQKKPSSAASPSSCPTPKSPLSLLDLNHPAWSSALVGSPRPPVPRRWPGAPEALGKAIARKNLHRSGKSICARPQE
jgi:hypothetical protein